MNITEKKCYIEADISAQYGWIPVTKRLPNDHDFEEGAPTRCWIIRRVYNLLDIDKYEDIIEDAYWRGDGFINQSICFGLTLPHVSHWMPYTIPEPPKEDDFKVAKSYLYHAKTAPLKLPVTVFVVATANNCDNDICLSEPFLSRQEAIDELQSSYYEAGGVNEGEPTPSHVSSCELSEDGYSVHLTNNDYYYGQIKEIVLGETSNNDFDDEDDEEYVD